MQFQQKFEFKRGVACLITRISPFCVIVSYQKCNEKSVNDKDRCQHEYKDETRNQTQVWLTFFILYFVYKMKFLNFNFLKQMSF